MIWMNKKLRDLREEEGFTLIELMVVVLIIAILIAIAIPTFLGARTRAQDRAAQSDLRNAVTAAKALYTDNSSYVNATEAALDAAEPAINFDTGASANDAAQILSVVATPGAANLFAAAKMSASGTCWYIRDYVNPSGTNPGTRWAKDTNSSTACTGAAAQGLADATYASRSPANAVETP